MGNGDADAESVASRLIFLSAASFILKSGSICGDYNIFASSFQEFFFNGNERPSRKKNFSLAANAEENALAARAALRSRRADAARKRILCRRRDLSKRQTLRLSF